MDTLEIIVNTTEINSVLYTDFPQNYQNLLNFLMNNLKSDLNFSIYWIDPKNDKIEVNNKKTFDIFCRMSTFKKLFVTNIKNVISEEDQSVQELKVEQNERNKDESTQNEKDKNSCNTEHISISCNGCNMTPIVGFRYKCLQCADYNLCMNCESNFVHNSHRMLRLPNRFTKREFCDYQNTNSFDRKPALIPILVDMFSNTEEDNNSTCILLSEILSKLINHVNEKREIEDNNTRCTFDTKPILNDSSISKKKN